MEKEDTKKNNSRKENRRQVSSGKKDTRGIVCPLLRTADRHGNKIINFAMAGSYGENGRQ